MKTSIKNLLLLPALITGFGLIPSGRATAQTFTNLYSFTAFNTFTNSDGANPRARLIPSGNTLYGTTFAGGSSGNGVVFAINTNGTGRTNLHNFTALVSGINSDGTLPSADLVLSGNTLYGVARGGGSSGGGTVYSINADGTGFTNLHSFTGVSDGSTPKGGLVLSGATLFGTASGGGSSSQGTVFAIKTNGTGFTNLHSFSAASDGSRPQAGLILSGNILFGTAHDGGTSGAGTVFAVNTNGTGFTNLHNFTSASDGANPATALVLSGNNLYGVAQGGGSSGSGTVFAISTNGTGFTNLYNFTALPFGTNSDGAYPVPGMILSGNTLYGTAFGGGSSGNGTVFAIHTDGTGITNLHSFAGSPSDGANPLAGLLLLGNTLYGTANSGGSSGNGTVFSLSLGIVSAPRLTIIHSGSNVILTWTNAVGFTLQSAPLVTGTFTNIVPAATSPFTNSISGGKSFFRLSQ